jgi:acetyltransferase-like isoleucine patch superfamily enzyme
MRNNKRFKQKESFILSTDGLIPPKNIWSYILMLFPSLFVFSWLRKLVLFTALKNCHQCNFEPGFRFFYGQKIHATNVSFSDALFMDYADIYIENGSGFGKNCKLITAKHNLLNRKEIIVEPIRIGQNVVISTSAIILGGVHIGNNSVIGAGSVVTHDIPANCLAAGNPAKIIRYIDHKQ